jgi:fumigallin biosynthesis monooxygenase-like protein
MARIFPGRYTARTDKPFVVFLIGMRVNQLWAVHKWMPVASAMPRMLKTLMQNPAKGLLGVETWVRWREVMTLQYWRSFDELEQFARNPSDPHLQAWKDFNQRVGSNGSVGIWHETFLVEAGQFECVYGNMPVYGLAAATAHVPAVGNRETARLRLGGESEPAVPSPPTPGQP